MYVSSITLLLADVFENFRNMSWNYELDHANIFSAPGLISMAGSFKKDHSKINFFKLIINMLLMVEKGIRGGICLSIYRYAKANNKYMKDFDKNKEWSYFNIWM